MDLPLEQCITLEKGTRIDCKIYPQQQRKDCVFHERKPQKRVAVMMDDSCIIGIDGFSHIANGKNIVFGGSLRLVSDDYEEIGFGRGLQWSVSVLSSCMQNISCHQDLRLPLYVMFNASPYLRSRPCLL